MGRIESRQVNCGRKTLHLSHRRLSRRMAQKRKKKSDITCVVENNELFTESIQQPCSSTAISPDPDCPAVITNDDNIENLCPAETNEKRRLFCTWHVDRAWRKNLVKIRSKETQCDVYKLIRTLMEETDEKRFEILFEKVYNSLTVDEETREFANYFFNNYRSNVRSWAFCFRLHCGINTNMHLERMHRTIKEFYCHGKKIKRLDKMLYILQKFIKDRLYDRLIIQHKGKLTSKISDLRKRHLASSKLDGSKIVECENGWMCPSFTSSKFYVIQESTKGCYQSNCHLKCIICNYCIHQFTCTCTDNAVKWNMCKHIHLLCQSHLIVKCNIDCDTANHLDNVGKEESAILSEVTKNKKRITTEEMLQEEKQKLVLEFQKLVEKADGEEIVMYKKEIIKMKTIASIRKESQNLSLHNQDKETEIRKRKEPGNKNMSPQKRFFSTKKKRIQKANILMKPDEDDKLEISGSLLTE